MLDFMRNGGWPMWPTLFLGVCAIALSIRDVLDGAEVGPSARRIGLAAMSLAIGGTLLDLTAVFSQARELPSDIVLVGVSEALCPAVLGLFLFALAQLAFVLGPARRLRA